MSDKKKNSKRNKSNEKVILFGYTRKDLAVFSAVNFLIVTILLIILVSTGFITINLNS